MYVTGQGTTACLGGGGCWILIGWHLFFLLIVCMWPDLLPGGGVCMLPDSRDGGGEGHRQG